MLIRINIITALKTRISANILSLTTGINKSKLGVEKMAAAMKFARRERWLLVGMFAAVILCRLNGFYAFLMKTLKSFTSWRFLFLLGISATYLIITKSPIFTPFIRDSNTVVEKTLNIRPFLEILYT